MHHTKVAVTVCVYLMCNYQLSTVSSRVCTYQFNMNSGLLCPFERPSRSQVKSTTEATAAALIYQRIVCSSSSSSTIYSLNGLCVFILLQLKCAKEWFLFCSSRHNNNSHPFLSHSLSLSVLCKYISDCCIKFPASSVLFNARH